MTAFLPIFAKGAPSRFALLQTGLVAGPVLLNALVSWRPAIHTWLERYQSASLVILALSLILFPHAGALALQLGVVTMAAAAVGAARSMAISSGYDSGREWVSRIQALRFFLNFTAEAAAGWTAGALAMTALGETGTLSVFGWSLIVFIMAAVVLGQRLSFKRLGWQECASAA